MSEEEVHPLIRLEEKFSSISVKVLRVLMAICLVVIFGSIFTLILTRYFLKSSIVGMYEVTTMVFLYMSVLGIIIAFIEREHIAITVLYDHSPHRMRVLVLALNYALVGLLNAGMGWLSLRWIALTGHYIKEITGTPQWVLQVSIPISCFWIALLSWFRLLCLLLYPGEVVLKIGGSEDDDEEIEALLAHEETEALLVHEEGA